MVFVARFLIEFIKENQVDFEDNLTINMGQILSLPYILVGIVFMIYGLINNSKLSGVKQHT
jgi:prolipoprotein diacylglyceryltransferase